MYPCLFITKKELLDAGIHEIEFQKDGRPANREDTIAVEDYCGRPIIFLRQSPISQDELLVFFADGFVRYNRISNNRVIVLTGNYDTLKVILTDIFKERREEAPFDIFNSYAYQADVVEQLDLQKWVRDEYKPS